MEQITLIRGTIRTFKVGKTQIYFFPEESNEAWWIGTTEGLLGKFWQREYPKLYEKLENGEAVNACLALVPSGDKSP